jgi:hypothetical protein
MPKSPAGNNPVGPESHRGIERCVLDKDDGFTKYGALRGMWDSSRLSVSQSHSVMIKSRFGPSTRYLRPCVCFVFSPETGTCAAREAMSRAVVRESHANLRMGWKLRGSRNIVAFARLWPDTAIPITHSQACTSENYLRWRRKLPG